MIFFKAKKSSSENPFHHAHGNHQSLRNTAVYQDVHCQA
jgi:hypothetical protein